jgi:hypothetical protein
MLQNLATGTANWLQLIWSGQVFTDLWAWIQQGQNIQGPIIAACVAIIVFVVSRMVDFAVRYLDRRSIRRRLVLGIYAEIESNLKEIVEFAGSQDFIVNVEQRIREDAGKKASPSSEAGTSAPPIFRPLIVITESSRFFSASAAFTPEIKPAALVPLMDFYRWLEELNARQSAFESKAFETISTNGRIQTVYDLWNTGSAAKSAGEHSLNVLRENYPRRWFKNLERAKRDMPIPKKAVFDPDASASKRAGQIPTG